MDEVTIYTDGACSGNPGPGGWGTILIYGEYTKELSGGEKETTNNRMELCAVIEGLQALKRPCKVLLYSDSQYVVNMIEKGWLERWRKNNWMRDKNSPAKNVDLLESLWQLLHTHEVHPVWVKGHAENKYNNRCDQMAVEASKRV